MYLRDLIGGYYEITYRNAAGGEGYFDIVILDTWSSEGKPYFSAIPDSSDTELTFRLNRIESGLPELHSLQNSGAHGFPSMKWTGFDTIFAIVVFAVVTLISVFTEY